MYIKDDQWFVDKFPWVAMDKGVHFLGGAFLVLLFDWLFWFISIISINFSMGAWAGIGWGWCLSSFCTLINEYFDGNDPEKGFSVPDLVYGIVGASLMLILLGTRLL